MRTPWFVGVSLAGGGQGVGSTRTRTYLLLQESHFSDNICPGCGWCGTEVLPGVVHRGHSRVRTGWMGRRGVQGSLSMCGEVAQWKSQSEREWKYRGGVVALKRKSGITARKESSSLADRFYSIYIYICKVLLL